MRLPSLACMVVGSAITLGAAARADTPSISSSDKIEADTARDLFRQGRDLYKKNQIAEARAKFLAAWGVKKHWQIALNLGATEFLLSRNREAAEHLTWADHESSGVPEDADIRWLHSRLPEALAKVARLTVVGDAGLEVRIDDEPPRTTPFGDVVFLDPGHHEVTVQGPNHPISTAVLQLIGGELRQLELSAAPPPEAAPPLPAPALPEAPAEPSYGKSSDARIVVLIAGSTLTVVGLGLGFYFTTQAQSADSDADRLRTMINQQLSGNCSVPNNLCTSLSNAVYDRAAWADRARFAFVTAGALAVATAGAWLLWPKNDSDSAKNKLQFGTTLDGIWVKGTF